ncbi:lasso RiPP family leader peptide-containing protein [Amycolatopsis xylanica]|uniref:lasso RiPP family leader peptide-containing protein n=1 Tax=Amycolatopsis xylanica TaxID=589385 RepID=UPI0015A08024
MKLISARLWQVRLSRSATRTTDRLCEYEPPRLFTLGSVRKVTLGSSSSGNADSNSQYYW